MIDWERYEEQDRLSRLADAKSDLRAALSELLVACRQTHLLLLPARLSDAMAKAEQTLNDTNR